MHALGTSLVWLCTLIVALPLSPCAFFASASCRNEPAIESALLSEPVSSCCAQHGGPEKQPGDRPLDEEGMPCQGECCRLSPFVPLAEKVLVDAQPLAVASALPQVVALPARPLALPGAVLAEAPPLQILHCQWRL